MAFKSFLLIAALATTVSTSTVASSPNESFTAVEGLEAQALAATEMEAIRGEISFQELIDAINASKWALANPTRATALVNYLTSLYSRFPKLFDNLLAHIKLPPLAR